MDNIHKNKKKRKYNDIININDNEYKEDLSSDNKNKKLKVCKTDNLQATTFLNKLTISSGDKLIKKKNIDSLKKINLSIIHSSNYSFLKNKKQIISYILSLNDIERLKLYKKHFIYEIYIKDIIKNNIPFSLLTENNICLKLNKLLNFKRNNILIKKLFTNTIYLSYSNNKIIPSIESDNKSSLNSFSLPSILSLKKQGLYLLCVDKFIVKIGSFSESQGIGGRINSFNGGRYDSGSITNKWFQQFIRECLINNLSCYFKVYFYDIEEIKINIFGVNKLIIPYVIRKFETELFSIYLTLNNNIPPIFGKNCN